MIIQCEECGHSEILPRDYGKILLAMNCANCGSGKQIEVKKVKPKIKEKSK